MNGRKFLIKSDTLKTGNDKRDVFTPQRAFDRKEVAPRTVAERSGIPTE